MEAMRILVMEFLAKVRAEVDQVIFFGLGLKIKALRDILKRMVRVFSQLGLKPKLLPGFNLRGRSRLKRSGRILRPRPLDVDSQVKANVGVIGVPNPDSGQGETSSEKAPVVISGDDVWVLQQFLMRRSRQPHQVSLFLRRACSNARFSNLRLRRCLKRKLFWHWDLLS
jgi:hypothetical protein